MCGYVGLRKEPPCLCERPAEVAGRRRIAHCFELMKEDQSVRRGRGEVGLLRDGC